jgi:hypothetical protein
VACAAVADKQARRARLTRCRGSALQAAQQPRLEQARHRRHRHVALEARVDGLDAAPFAVLSLETPSLLVRALALRLRLPAARRLFGSSVSCLCLRLLRAV